MPLLDVAFILDDALFQDGCSVRRRANIVGDNGRVSPLGEEFFNDVGVVVTQQSPQDLMKTEDGQMIPRRIFLASRFQFIALAPGFQPDEIVWNGVAYTVTESLPYSRYGDGFYEVIAEFRNAIPPLQ